MNFSCKLFCLFVFIFICKTTTAQIQLHEWNDNLYTVYTFETFQKLEVVSQIIDPDNIDYSLLRAAIFYCTNKERVKHQKKRFKHSVPLQNAAHKHSLNMVKYNFMSHFSSIANQETMSKRLESEGFDDVYCAENIIAVSLLNPSYWDLASEIVEECMSSASNKKNIFDDLYKYLACGVCKYHNFKWSESLSVKAVQNFSSRDVN